MKKKFITIRTIGDKEHKFTVEACAEIGGYVSMCAEMGEYVSIWLGEKVRGQRWQGKSICITRADIAKLAELFPVNQEKGKA